MVTIRLARHGGKKLPFYHVTVADRAAKRDGRFIERVGFFNPMARGGEVSLRIDLERVDHWLSVGAQPSLRVKQLVAKARKGEALSGEREGSPSHIESPVAAGSDETEQVEAVAEQAEAGEEATAEAAALEGGDAPAEDATPESAAQEDATQEDAVPEPKQDAEQ